MSKLIFKCGVMRYLNDLCSYYFYLDENGVDVKDYSGSLINAKDEHDLGEVEKMLNEITLINNLAISVVSPLISDLPLFEDWLIEERIKDRKDRMDEIIN